MQEGKGQAVSFFSSKKMINLVFSNSFGVSANNVFIEFEEGDRSFLCCSKSLFQSEAKHKVVKWYENDFLFSYK